MKEILGNNLETVFDFFDFKAIKTYQNINDKTDFAQVWEMEDDTLENLNNIPDELWTDDFGWYRCAEGSNMGEINRRYKINNHYITAWDGVGREQQEEENKMLVVDDRYDLNPRKYDNLLQYFCEEVGASTKKNVTALATDLAKQNNIKLSELFTKYQG